MTTSLINKKFAYVSEGHVYFSVSNFKEYGKLSNKNLEELKAGSRIEISKLKKNPMDFLNILKQENLFYFFLQILKKLLAFFPQDLT